MREYRDYYAPTSSYGYTGGWTPAVAGIAIVNVAVFLATYVASKIPGAWSGAEIYHALALVPAKALGGHRYWQFVTYAFLHDLTNPFHLIFNMYFLWVGGRELEFLFGPARFVRFYLTAAVMASVGYLALSLPFHDISHVPMLGASGAVMAVLVVYAFYHPNDRMMLLLFVDVPVWLGVIVMIGMDLSLLAHMSQGHGIAAGCHLGGAAFGVLYWRLGDRLEGLLQRRGEAVRALLPRRPARPTAVAPVPPPLLELEAELDRVLKRLHEVGMAKLTTDEKAVLERASQHYRKKA